MRSSNIITLSCIVISNYLFLEGVEVVVVDVRVAQRVHELPGGQPRDVGDHVREKGVAARGKVRIEFLL